MRLPRRRSVLAGLGTLLLAPGVPVWWWATRVRSNDIRPLVRAVLERHLESVAHEDGAVEAFLADMAVDLPVPELCWLGLAAPLLRRQERLADIPLVGHRLRRLEAWAITHFMLSTDAFRPGRPEGQPIRYVGYYEPRLAPGLNPLADLRPTDC